jgi:transposase InsO family protein
VDKARYLVEAHVLEGRSVGELAAAHGVHRSWIYKLLGRYRAGGYEALATRSRRPRSCKHETPSETVKAIVELRSELEAQGHDAGAETIAYHLAQRQKDVPSLSTIWRILRREGLVVAQRQKRPHCSLVRFEADLPNEMWQADVTAWQLASGQVVEILNLIDDHSRLFLCSDAYLRVKAADVVQSFHGAAELHGLPASMLSDNGAVFTGSYRGGKVLFEYELERLGVEFKNSRPYHPQTCGKVERLHQTLKRYLAKQPPAQTLTELQRQLAAFVHYYNHIRPAQGARQAHAATGLQRPPEGAAGRPNADVLLPGALRQGRQDGQGQPALRQPPIQNRPRQGPQGPLREASDRRREHSRDRLRG